jgi:hypothetical protein
MSKETQVLQASVTLVSVITAVCLDDISRVVQRSSYVNMCCSPRTRVIIKIAGRFFYKNNYVRESVREKYFVDFFFDVFDDLEQR